MYNYPPYYPPYPPQYQNSQQFQNYQSLEDRLKRIESRQDFNIQPQNAPNGQQNTPPQQSSSQIPFISVKSADEAWAYKVDDWRLAIGEKFYFINEINGEMYVRYFDANTAQAHKKTYREVDTEQPAEKETEQKSNIIDSITPKIEALNTRIDELSDEIYNLPTLNEIKELIINGYKFYADNNMVVDDKKPAARNKRGQYTKSSDGSGEE